MGFEIAVMPCASRRRTFTQSAACSLRTCVTDAGETADLEALAERIGCVPLLRGTVAAVLDGGLANGMGGCVARGDVGTVATHLTALDAASLPAGALYRELAARTIPLGIERGTLSPARAAEIARVLTAPTSAAASPEPRSLPTRR